jgi:competence protein ComEC
MNGSGAALLCWGYVLGLLLTGILGVSAQFVPWQEWAGLALGAALLGMVAATVMPRFWRMGPSWKAWVAAGLVAALAIVYFQFRVPEPGANDVSRRVPEEEFASVQVEGKVLSMPAVTRSDHARFWLQAKRLRENTEVTGKLYVTIPLLQATGIYPGHRVVVTGNLYQPQPALNPGAFDFEAYLAREGAFAGLNGREVEFAQKGQGKPWGWWRLRQRIIRAQVRWLGSPAGQLVSSMVLGRRAVDLPYDLRDRFIRAGLAHVLAASGFHVSLILGVVLSATRRFSERTQFSIGLGTLVIYVGLTGIQPSVMRAAIMGVAGLIALSGDRQVKPLGALLLAATLLLLFNPLWIWNLGFQLSFLATLGLIVTLPALTARLDWIPPAIATAIAIPLAVFPWILPLQLYVFGVIPTYSIFVNVITVPLTIIITLGGAISGLVALIFPLAGSALAWLLYYPAHLLIAIVQFFTSLPGSSLTLGTIGLVQVFTLYGLMGLVWLSQWCQKRWGLVALFAVGLIASPMVYSHAASMRVTVLATSGEPVAIIQNRGKVTLINSGEADTVQYTVLPFLQQQGIARLDCAVALSADRDRGWSQIRENVAVEAFWRNPALQEKFSSPSQSLPVGEKVSVGNSAMTLVSARPPLLKLQIRDRDWLFLGKVQPSEKDAYGKIQTTPQVLLWSGNSLPSDWLETLQPQVAIASSSTVDADTLPQLRSQHTQLYKTGQDGAIQWTPHAGFETTHSQVDADAAFDY